MSLRKPKPAVAAPYRGPGSTGSPADRNPYAVLSMHQARLLQQLFHVLGSLQSGPSQGVHACHGARDVLQAFESDACLSALEDVFSVVT
jgi:hypothetical protein